MAEKLTDKVNFQFIRYANCWEDADILCKALNIAPNGKILSIASAGDNSFSLLLTNPEIVVAVDVNEIQLHLVELKKACFKTLQHVEMLQFLGFTDCSERLNLFEKVIVALPQASKEYWESKKEELNTGVIHAGKFEKYFRYFCKKVLPFIHSKATIQELFRKKTEEEQKHFYSKKWNNWRWKLLFKIFFSRRVMGRYGRDPEFLKQVKINVSEFIYKRAEAQLSGTAAFDNFILRYNLTGNFGELLPHYLQKENFVIIQKNIDKLVVMKGYAEDAIGKYGPFDAMNLSNIFEYLDEHTFRQVASKLLDGLRPAGKMAYWNLMVPRKISQTFPEKLSYDEKTSKALHNLDKGFFYSDFITEIKHG